MTSCVKKAKLTPPEPRWCDGCDVRTIQGVVCHEFGCPVRRREMLAEQEHERELEREEEASDD